LKFFNEDLQLKLFSRLAGKQYSSLDEALRDLEGKTAFFQATDWHQAVEILGFLRNRLIKDLDLLKGKEDQLFFLWVTDFPMFEFDEETGEVGAMHHPFTKPKDEYIDFIKQV
jgi:aspartyl-tRNA synthetase